MLCHTGTVIPLQNFGWEETTSLRQQIGIVWGKEDYLSTAVSAGLVAFVATPLYQCRHDSQGFPPFLRFSICLLGRLDIFELWTPHMQM